MNNQITEKGTRENPYKLYIKEDSDQYQNDISPAVCTYQEIIIEDDEFVDVYLTLKNGETCYVQYKKKKANEIIKVIEQNGMFEGYGLFIRDFDTEGRLPPFHKISSFSLQYCYLEGKLNFESCEFCNFIFCISDSIFADTKVNFRNVFFSNNELIFRNIFVCSEFISFEKVKFKNAKFIMYNSFFCHSKLSFQETDFDVSEIEITNSDFDESYIHFYRMDWRGKNSVFSIKNADAVRFDEVTFLTDMKLNIDSINQLSITDCSIKSIFEIKGSPSQKEKLEVLSFSRTNNWGKIDIDWNECNVKQAIINGYPIKSGDRKAVKRYKYKDISMIFI